MSPFLNRPEMIFYRWVKNVVNVVFSTTTSFSTVFSPMLPDFLFFFEKLNGC